MKILITGGTGRLGGELVKVFGGSLHPTKRELDITNLEAIIAFMRRERPEMIIHCAALTGIRECEENKKLAWQTNVKGTANLVDACRTYCSGTYFVYVSTACVFYGDRGGYQESDIPYPKNFYSLTKLLGEFVVERLDPQRRLIVRTNFVARERWPHAKAFVDRYGTYLFADDLAGSIQSIVNRRLTGVVHVCGREKMSMYELARLTTLDVEPMTLTEYRGPALTVDMSLRSSRIEPFEIRKNVAQVASAMSE